MSSLKQHHQKSTGSKLSLKRWAREEVAQKGSFAVEAEEWLNMKAARLYKLSSTKAKKLGK